MRSRASRAVGGVLSVGVLVDLEWSERSGGHIRSWRRFAEAAVAWPERVDLTVYYLGTAPGRIEIGANARLVLVPPGLGTRRVPFLRGAVRHTDLAPWRPALAQALARHDVLHATAPFAFGRTALRVARRTGMPLVSSIHSDFPTLSRIYGRDLACRLLGRGAAGRFIVERLRFDALCAGFSRRRLDRLLRACDRVLVSHPAERARLSRFLDPAVLGPLRRGIDHEVFHPRHRDRARLHRELGVPADRPVALFVGRVDASKNVMTLARAARRLIDAGRPLHVLVVGTGDAADALRRELGAHVTLPGFVPHERIPWIQASADAFVFPSESEVMPNVVLEAKASGTPPILSTRDGGAVLVEASGRDGLLVDDPSPEAWAAAMTAVLHDPERRARMGRAARRAIETGWPTWSEVLREDLLPVWEAAARRQSL